MNRQKNFLQIVFPVLLAGLIFLPQPTRAANTGACHCFRHRKYDSKAPFAADDYLLTTSFNSLTAAHFKLSKKQLIYYKMKAGIQADDLLITLYLARSKNLDPDKLLAARTQTKSWTGLLSSFPTLADDHHDKLINMLRKSRSAADCGIYVADNMIAGFYGLSPTEITSVRKQGLKEKEMALLFFLAQDRGLPAKQLIRQVKEEGRSWSEVAFYLGLNPKTVGREILECKK